jgi:hypothetical protein
MKDNAINVMKLNVLDSHDRLLELKKSEAQTLGQGAEDCLKKNPLSLALQEKSPYIYMFAHPRTEADGNTKKMFWQPRLTKPQAQTNSYLFRAISKSDSIEICWMLPSRETWGQHKKGNIAENELVEWSINMFLNKKKELEEPHPDDLPEAKMKMIYYEVLNSIKAKKWQPKLDALGGS